MNEKYTTSKIDGKTYCRKNGQFLRHLKSNGFDYKSYYDSYIGNEEYCTHCNRPKTFLKSSMKYAKTCGSPECIGKESSKTKDNFLDEKWELQANKYRLTMSSKPKEELQAIEDRRRKTNIKKYGAEHPWASDVIRKKISNTMKIRYGSSNFSDITVKKYLELNGKYNSSSGQQELFNYIQSLNVDCRENVRDILPSGREVDIYIPEYNLALEFCGLFWHSDYHTRIDKNYHYDKYKECIDLGIELWTIYEDEWENCKNIIKKKIKYRLNLVCDKIYARKTEFRIIDSKQSKKFLMENHIQGNGRGGYTYGLFDQDNLVAVMVFRKSSNDEYVLDRFATSKVVVGGFSKLLKNAIPRLIGCKRIVTFADCRWSQGKLYEEHFEYDKFLNPDYYYIQNARRYHKFNFRRKHLEKRLKTFDPQLSESENCRRNNVFKIYDCGKKRYIKHV